MDSLRAREVLRLYRPGTTDALDPQMAEALQAVQRDPELGDWFEEHCGVYIAIRNKLKQIEVPQDLKRKILLENIGREKVIPLHRRPPVLWAAAAAIALLLAGTWFLNKPATKPSFTKFHEWKIGEVQRGYAMIGNTNYAQIVSYLTTNHFIANYTLSKALAKLPAEGFATKPYQGKPVTMLCFNGGIVKNGKTNDLYFFVAQRADFADSPSPGKKPRFGHAGKYTTASWSAGDKVYILAGQGDDSDLQQYID
jgi:hypothetical protein